MADSPEPHAASPCPDPDREDTRRLEELLFECLEARDRGDTARLAQLMPSDPQQAESLRQRLGIADELLGSKPVQRLGEYELLRELGAGGMGVVHLALQPRLQRLVAIKVIRPELLASAKMRERFQREARALARVAHPGICPVYDFGEFEGQPCLVMQYLPGKRLSELPAPKHRADLDALLQRFEQSCEAVQVAHDAGLVHRDLKPQNIVLAADGHPVVLDFGLARILEDEQPEQGLTTQSQPVGTPAYMAPERLTGAANATGPGVDVYALGTSLYQCIAGELPFHSPVLEALWSQILRGEASARPLQQRWMPKELLVVVRTAMEREPARRYATARSLGEDLRRLRLDLPILAQQPSTMTRVVRWTRRNRAVASLLVGLLVAFGVALLLVLGLVIERRSNLSQVLAGEAARHQGRNPALQARIALAALDEKDQERARSELAKSLANWQLAGRLVEREFRSDGAIALPKGGMAAIVDGRAVVTSRAFGARTRFERPDGGTVRSCAIDPGESQLALAGDDGILWLFDLGNGSTTKVEVAAHAITLLQYSPDGSHLAIATDHLEGNRMRTGQLHLLDRTAGSVRQLGSWPGRSLFLLQLVFSGDSARLFTVVQTKFVTEHAIADGSLVREIPPFAREPDGSHNTIVIALIRGGTALVCGCQTGALFEVDLASGSHALLGNHDLSIATMALSPDGRTLASVGEDRTVRLWSLGDKPRAGASLVLRHPVRVTNVAFDRSGDLLATGANDMVVRYWTTSGDMVLELASGVGATLLLTLGDHEAWLGSEWNGCGHYQLVAHGRRIHLGHSPVSSLLPSPTRDVLWTGHHEGSVRQLATDVVQPIAPARNGAIIGLDAVDDTMLLAIEEGVDGHVHDLVRGGHQSLPPGGGRLCGGWILDGGREICLQTWGLAAAGNALTRFRRPADGAPFKLVGERQLLPMRLGTGTVDARRASLLLPRRHAGDGGGLLVVDLAGAGPPREFPGEPCSTVACSPFGGLIATCMTSHVQLRRSLDDPAPLRLHTDSSGTNALRFAPDGRHLAAISTSGAVWLFATADGQLVWRGEVPAIGRCVAFTPDGRYLLTGDSDGIVRHWLVEPADQRRLAEERLRAWQWDAEDERILREHGIDPGQGR